MTWGVSGVLERETSDGRQHAVSTWATSSMSIRLSGSQNSSPELPEDRAERGALSVSLILFFASLSDTDSDRRSVLPVENVSSFAPLILALANSQQERRTVFFFFFFSLRFQKRRQRERDAEQHSSTLTRDSSPLVSQHSPSTQQSQPEKTLQESDTKSVANVEGPRRGRRRDRNRLFAKEKVFVAQFLKK